MAIRSRQCMLVLYPESQSDAIAYAQEHWPCAWALHDLDVDEDGVLKKPHVHFVCNFPNARSFSGIAKELGVSEATVNRCNSLWGAWQYLTHEQNPDKYHYSRNIIGTHNFEAPKPDGGQGNDEPTQVAALLTMPCMPTTRQMARWAFEHGCWKSFKENYAMWRDINNEQKDAKKYGVSYDDQCSTVRGNGRVCSPQ